MKTTKLFFMAALALMTAACSNDDNEFAQQPQKAEGITITAQLAPKTSGATTRAVSDGGNKIESEWAENEHIAILYEVSSTKYVADATITAVDGSGAATITFEVESGTADNTPCTLVYPAKLTDGTTTVYKDDLSGVKDAATLLAAQDGTLSANLDVRVGAGTIQTTTPGLTVTTQPAAQFAIFKFTVKNSDASATIDVKPLTVTIGSQDYVITPASATSELYAALPAVSDQTVSFTATDDRKTYACSKDNITFAAGKYYQSTLKMALDKITWNIFPTSSSASSFSQDGITLTAECLNWHQHSVDALDNSGKFMSTVGNFTKIEITAKEFSMGAGWTVSGNKATWAGTPSSTVTFKATGYAPAIYWMEGTSPTMVFYFQ